MQQGSRVHQDAGRAVAKPLIRYCVTWQHIRVLLAISQNHIGSFVTDKVTIIVNVNVYLFKYSC